MASQPDPNSPFVASQLQADFGIRAPGTPSMAGKPTPQAGDVTFPAPPSPAGAPVGRPPTPGVPAPTPPTSPTSPTAAPAPATPPGTPAGAAPTVPPPLVTPTAGTMGDPRLALSPEGDARYRDAIVQGRTALGPVPAVFRNPALPQIPFELGKPNFNPFTGQFS